MSAQDTLIEYAESKQTSMLAKDLIGAAFSADGVVIERTSNSVKVCKISKPNGRKIVVTELTTTRTPEVVNGKVNMVETTEAVEVMRLSL